MADVHTRELDSVRSSRATVSPRTLSMLIPLLVFLQAQSGLVAMDQGWELSGPGTVVEKVRGIDAIRIDNGRAVRRDVAFENGFLDFDVELTPYRSFIYLQFRMEADGEFEEIYFRPHKNGAPDAVQYNPVWRGDSFWQLYHGTDASASPRFRFGTWTHVRLQLQGQFAALFLDGDTIPKMVTRLARPSRAGYIAIRAFTPVGGDLPAGTRAASFANVAVYPSNSLWHYRVPDEPRAPVGAVLSWQLSRPFRGDTVAITALPDSLMRDRERWPTYRAEPSGMLIVNRHLARPRPIGGVVARFVLRSSGPRRQRLRLGYSDAATVFVNGAPVFAGDAHYSYDQPRQEGLVGLWQSTIWLPLKDGDNEVCIAVQDGFGGWALMGQLVPGDGAELVPARP